MTTRFRWPRWYFRPLLQPYLYYNVVWGNGCFRPPPFVVPYVYIRDFPEAWGDCKL